MKLIKFSDFWKFQKFRNLTKTSFLVFALFVGIFSNKDHYIRLKFLRRNCFCYSCPKCLFPKLFVPKVNVSLTSSRRIQYQECRVINCDMRQTNNVYSFKDCNQMDRDVINYWRNYSSLLFFEGRWIVVLTSSVQGGCSRSRWVCYVNASFAELLENVSSLKEQFEW